VSTVAAASARQATRHACTFPRSLEAAPEPWQPRVTGRNNRSNCWRSNCDNAPARQPKGCTQSPIGSRQLRARDFIGAVYQRPQRLSERQLI
jgi:hypothetical protein